MNSIILAILGSTGFYSLVTMVIGIAQAKKNSKSNEKELLIALAHDRIIHICKEPLRRGSITEDELTNINTIGEAYVKAGGNHLAKKYLQDVQKLPIVD